MNLAPRTAMRSSFLGIPAAALIAAAGIALACNAVADGRGSDNPAGGAPDASGLGNPASNVGNPASEIGNPAGGLFDSPASSIDNPAGTMPSNPASSVADPAGAAPRNPASGVAEKRRTRRRAHDALGGEGPPGN